LKIAKMKIGVHKKAGLALAVFAVAYGLPAFPANR
jgi:hypothetical protein